MFLPKSHFSQGAGFTNLEYGLMAELLGKSKVASEVCPSPPLLAFHMVEGGEYESLILGLMICIGN